MVHIHVTVKTITKSELKHSCHQSPYFALIADETTDKVTTTHVCVRFTEAVGDEVVVQEIFLGKKIKSTTAVAQLLKYFLNKHNIKQNKMRAQGYDGARYKCGKHNDTGQKTGFRCYICIFQNTLPRSGNCIQLKEQSVRTLLEIVQEIAFAFDYSAKRLETQTQLKKLCETRQFSRSDAFTTFLKTHLVMQ